MRLVGLQIGVLVICSALVCCARVSDQHPYANYTWSPAPFKTPEIRYFPLRSPYIERLDAQERSEAASIIARTSKTNRKWLRYAFARPPVAGELTFVIFAMANGEQSIYKQLNSPSCNAGYDPIENTTLAMSGCNEDPGFER